MTTLNKSFTKSVIAIALLAAFGPVCAEEVNVDEMIKPSSSVSLGAGVVSGNPQDRTIFGQYNGLRKDDVTPLIDFDVIKRDDAAGLWTTIFGRNIGLDNQELNFSQQKQGNWKYSLGYDEITKHDIRTINTGMLGAGTATPTVSLLPVIGGGSNLDLTLKRKGLTLSGEKWITPNLLLDLSFKNEDKDGARLFGKGMACTSGAATPNTTCGNPTVANGGLGVAGWATLMLPEPVNSTTRQFEAKLNWSGENFLVTGGYYGSFFQNGYSTLSPTVAGTLTNAGGGTPSTNAELMNILNLPIALPPDNQAHQFYLSGNYAFTPKTRATFKYSYTHATQDQDFGIFTAAAPAGRTNLGGEVNSTLLQVGLTSRPMPKLALAANLKYEDKNDKTPIALYNIEGATTFTNSQLDNKKLTGKVEATYHFLSQTRGTLGVDYASVKRALPPDSTDVAGISGLRGKTEEVGYRAEVRHSFADSLNGALAYVSSKRTGSDWYNLCTSTSGGATSCANTMSYGQIVPASTIVAASSTSIFPMMLTDRNRDKLRLSADWSPTDALSIQISAEDGKDSYTTAGTKGLRDTGMSLVSLDATWVISENLKLTAFASHGEQSMLVKHSTGYVMDLTNTNDSFGVGLVAQPTGKLQIGADLSYFSDKDQYKQTLDPAASGTNLAIQTANPGNLPDVSFRVTTLKLYGKYALDKSSDIRVDLINQDAKLSEWTWSYNGTPYIYSDRTTVGMKPDQRVTFLGARYTYKFQ